MSERNENDSEIREEDLLDGTESLEEMDRILQAQDDDERLRPEEFGIKMGKSTKIYCDKKQFYEEIKKFQKQNIATNALGENIIKIAIHMTTMARFFRYSHVIKEELAEHAIEQMWYSVPKFNLKDKKKNPFGYFSMICYRDMLHTLKKHFKQENFATEIAHVQINRMSGSNPSDERLSMLRQTLERNETYKEFLKNDKHPFAKKEVDTFALSKKEQIRRYKESLKKAKGKSK